MKFVTTISTIVMLFCISMSSLFSANNNEECFTLLAKRIEPCLADEEISKQIFKVARMSLWMEEKSKQFIELSEKNNIDWSRLLLESIRLVRQRTGVSTYSLLDFHKGDYYLIALLTFKKSKLVNIEDVEEYLQCTFPDELIESYEKEMSGLYIFFNILDKCLSKKLIPKKEKKGLFVEATAMTNEICTPNWIKIENAINEISTKLTESKLHFKSINKSELSLVPIPNHLHDVKLFYDSMFSEKLFGIFMDLPQVEANRLVNTSIFLEAKAFEFNRLPNKKEIIERVYRKEGYQFPTYTNIVLPVTWNLIFAYALEEAGLISCEEKKTIMENLSNINLIREVLYFRYINKPEKYENVVFKEEQIRQRYFEETFSLAYQISQIPNDVKYDWWYKKISFNPVNYKNKHSSELFKEILQFYKETFEKIPKTDVSLTVDEIGLDNLIYSLLCFEEEASSFIAEHNISEDNNNKPIISKSTERYIENVYFENHDALPSCICEEMPSEKQLKHILTYIINEQLENEIDKENNLMQNILNLLRIERIIKIKHKKDYDEYINRKKSFFSNTCFLEKCIHKTLENIATQKTSTNNNDCN